MVGVRPLAEVVATLSSGAVSIAALLPAPEHVVALCSAVASTLSPVEHLDLTGSRFGSSGSAEHAAAVRAVAFAIAQAPELRALQLGSCSLGETAIALLLAGTRSPGSRLEALDVSRTCSASEAGASGSGTASARHSADPHSPESAPFGQVAQAIVDAGQRLVRLSFNGVPLGQASSAALGKALLRREAAGRGVEALSVGSTGGGDALCEALSPTIATGTLRLVDLSDCGAGDAGLEAVAIALSSPDCRAEDLRLGGNCLSAGDGMLGGMRIGRELALRACAAAVEAAAIVASGAGEDASADDGTAIVASNARRSLPTVVDLTGRTMRSALQAAREGAGEALAESLAGILAGDVSVELAEGDAITASPALAPVVQAAAVEALRAIGIDPVLQLMALESRTTEAERRAAAAEDRAAQAEARADAVAAAAAAAASQAVADRAAAATAQAEVRALASTVERLAARLAKAEEAASSAAAAVPSAARAEASADRHTDESLVPTDAGPDPRVAEALSRATASAERAEASAEASQAQVAELTSRLGTLEEAVLREQADTIAALEAILASHTEAAQ